MRVLKNSSTGRMLMACSISSAEVLMANGEALGYDINDLEVLEVTEEELKLLISFNTNEDLSRVPSEDRRAARYAAEVDPLVKVWASYTAEGNSAKAAEMAAQINSLKASIREELP